MALISDLAEQVATWAEGIVSPILVPLPPPPDPPPDPPEPEPVQEIVEARIVYGDVSIDECCPFDLVVAVGNITPQGVPIPNGCDQPWAVVLTVVVSGCIATMDEQGRPLDAWADMVPVLDAGQALYGDLACHDYGDDWELRAVSLTPLGAEGGCVSSVLTAWAWDMS